MLTPPRPKKLSCKGLLAGTSISKTPSLTPTISVPLAWRPRKLTSALLSSTS